MRVEIAHSSLKSTGQCGIGSSACSSVRPQKITKGAFSAIRTDGSVDTWGDGDKGGDSSQVQYLLEGVQQIQGTERAWAIVDGSVVAWGNPDCGGDSSAVQLQLRKVQQVQATRRAFAAILADGSLVTWGCPKHGGDSSQVRRQLRGF